MRSLCVFLLALAAVGAGISTALASPRPEVAGGYSSAGGHAGAQPLRATLRLRGNRVTTLSATIARYCSDGSRARVRVRFTGVDRLAGSRVRRTADGGALRVRTSHHSSGSLLWRVRLHAVRDGHTTRATGTIRVRDLAMLPADPMPAPGARCGTNPDGSSSPIAFDAHGGVAPVA